LAEDIGFHLGDGYLGNYSTKSNPHKYELTYGGNLTDEYDYYNSILLKRKFKLFGAKFIIRKNEIKNSITCRSLSKALVTFYENTIGIKSGKKLSATIPDIILKANKNIQISFVRGLIDADGCLTFSKKYKRVSYYPIIEIGLVSKGIIDGLKLILKRLGFSFSSFIKQPNQNYRCVRAQFCISLSGVCNLEKWMNLIGFKNRKNIVKYKLWKANGFCPSENEIRKILKMSGSGKI